MISLTKNLISGKFNLQGTDTIVILNGIYQPQLSDANSKLTLEEKTLKIPKNTHNKTPIHLLFLTTQNYSRELNLIAEEGSYTTIIEEHASLEEKPYSYEIRTKLMAAKASRIAHYKLLNLGATHSNHQESNEISQSSNSKITSIFINHGAKIVQDSISVKFTGENASYNTQGINLLYRGQTISTQIRIEHSQPGCTSSVLSKSIVASQATHNFACRVVVSDKATKTETHVTNKNLLLAETATANTAPELEVYTDDIICTHGATVGQLDKEALFYLRSRGINRDLAVKMLTTAFVQEVTNEFLRYDRLKMAADLLYV